MSFAYLFTKRLVASLGKPHDVIISRLSSTWEAKPRGDLNSRYITSQTRTCQCIFFYFIFIFFWGCHKGVQRSTWKDHKFYLT